MKADLHRYFFPCNLLLALVICCAPAFSFDLKPYEIHYESTVRGIKVNTVLKLSAEGTSFTLSQIISAMMMRTEELSTFTLADNQAVPESYRYKRTVFGRSLVREILFYPEQKQATFRQGDAPVTTIKLEGNIYDPLGSYIPLQIYLAQHPESTSLAPIRILERERIREFTFKVLGTEWLQTPLGYMETLKIERLRSSKNKQTTIWLAKQWDYAVVRITHQEPEEPAYQMNIVKGTIGNRAMAGSPLPAGNYKDSR